MTSQQPCWDTWKPTEQSALLFLFQQDQVLLIEKKRGLGKGKISAPGGHLEQGETFAQAAIRETREEIGIEIFNPLEIACLSFAFTSGYNIFVKVFFSTTFQGTLKETDEAKPFWNPVSDLPWKKMWSDNAIWLPLALKGYYVQGRFFLSNEETISHEIKTSLLQK